MKRNKNIRKIVLCLFLILLIAVYIVKYKPFGLPDIEKQIKAARSIKEYDFTLMGDDFKSKIYDKYDTVLFGKYKQGIFGVLKSPIEWIVLEKNDNSVVLLSKHILDFAKYNTAINNDTFFDEAFDKNEKEKIVNNNEPISIMNEEEITYYFDTDGYYNTKKGFDEKFCKTANISYEILYDNATTSPTYFALKKLFEYYNSVGKPIWFFNMLKDGKFNTYEYWLKNEIDLDGIKYAKTLNAQGFIDSNEIEHRTVGIRPIITIDVKHSLDKN